MTVTVCEPENNPVEIAGCPAKKVIFHNNVSISEGNIDDDDDADDDDNDEDVAIRNPCRNWCLGRE